jgi:ssDNA-binding Zn-finger/Zn-ribbon topoisomerase 1
MLSSVPSEGGYETLMKAAKFFCDSCGAQVDREAPSCPGCGRFFSSVRCPKCDHTGPSSIFKNGCPRCGYSRPAEPAPAEAPPRGGRARGAFPAWAWALAALGALAAVVALILAMQFSRAA